MRDLLRIPLFSILVLLGLSSCAHEAGYTPQRTYDPCETMSSCGLSIKQAITDNWRRPEGARNHMVVIIEFRLTGSFEIESSRIIEGSGNDTYDKYAMEAAKKASPFVELSGLSDDDFRKYFSTFRLHFDPIDLGR